MLYSLHLLRFYLQVYFLILRSHSHSGTGQGSPERAILFFGDWETGRLGN